LYLAARPIRHERKAVVWLGSNDAIKLWVNKNAVRRCERARLLHAVQSPGGNPVEQGNESPLLEGGRAAIGIFSVRIGFKEHNKTESIASALLHDLE